MRVLDHVDLVHLFDRTVTGLAVEAGGHVPVVTELHVLRNPMDLEPLDGRLALPVVLQRADYLDLLWRILNTQIKLSLLLIILFNSHVFPGKFRAIMLIMLWKSIPLEIHQK